VRVTSQYEYDCTECGTFNVTPTRDTSCSGCGVAVTLEWRATAGMDKAKPAPEPTISAAYDGNGHGLIKGKVLPCA
jgi:DNA-directed RNA polymerase subunit RPC12/RpoP